MLSPATVQRIIQALDGLRFGSVQLVVHDAHIIRIERIERIRLTGSPEASDRHTAGRPTTTEARHGVSEEV